MAVTAGKKMYIEDFSAELATLTALVTDLTSDMGQVQGGGGVLAIAAKVRNDGSTSISPSTTTALSFSDPADVEFDDYGYHSTSSNPSRFTVPAGKGGIHEVTGDVPFASDNTGTFRAAYVLLNGTTRIGATKIPPANATMRFSVVTGPVQLSALDYVELVVEHDASGSVAVDGTGDYAAHFGIKRLGT